ncbi:hypothetical protein [Methylobacterium sp. A54F]
MRTWIVAGVAVLALAGGSQEAEARGGRGFGRLFSGHVRTVDRPTVPGLSRAGRPEARTGTLRAEPALILTPGRTAAAAGAGAGVPALTAEAVPAGEPAARPARAETPRPVQEARAVYPPCASDRRVGGLGQEATGFCLIN